jgi:hypothetical protein
MWLQVREENRKFTYPAFILAIAKKNPQNLAMFLHFFHKNPLYELQWNLFLLLSFENLPKQKKTLLQLSISVH